MKQAIGILTFCKAEAEVRERIIKIFIESLLDVNKEILKKFEIFISDDNSTSATFLDYLKRLEQLGINVLWNKENKGVSVNSNRLIKVFQERNYQNMFLLNDDNLFLKDGLFDNYCELLDYGIDNHFSFIGHNYYPGALQDPIVYSVQDKEIQYHTSSNGVLLAFNKKCLETVGGFYVGPAPWGGEHIDYSLRAAKGKMCGLFPDFKQSNEYFRIEDIGERFSNFSLGERVLYGQKNSVEMEKYRISQHYCEVRC